MKPALIALGRESARYVRWRTAVALALGYVGDAKPGHPDRPATSTGDFMKHESKGQPFKPANRPKPETRDTDAPKEKSEAAEVAGRHKNSGQKDHKGAR